MHVDAEPLELLGEAAEVLMPGTTDLELVETEQAVENAEEIAAEGRVMLICGHTHRAIFASEPYAVKLRQREADLEARLRSDPNDEEAAEWLRELRDIRESLNNERRSKRDIPALDDDPAPCYFNTGCGLYTGGITAIELDNDEIRLVKWHSDPKREERRELLRPAARLSALLDRL